MESSSARQGPPPPPGRRRRSPREEEQAAASATVGAPAGSAGRCELDQRELGPPRARPAGARRRRAERGGRAAEGGDVGELLGGGRRTTGTRTGGSSWAEGGGDAGELLGGGGRRASSWVRRTTGTRVSLWEAELLLHNKQEFPLAAGVDDLLVVSIGSGSSSGTASPGNATPSAGGWRTPLPQRSPSPAEMVRLTAEGVADMVDQAVAMAFGHTCGRNYVRIQVRPHTQTAAPLINCSILSATTHTRHSF